MWRQHWTELVIITAIVEALFLLVAWWMPQVYRAEVVLAPQNRTAVEAAIGAVSGQLGGLTSFLGIGGNKSADNEQSLAVLRSSAFARSFIREHNLLPILFARKWDADRQRWRSQDPDHQPTIADGVRKFIEDVRTVSVDPATGIITLRVDWTNPQLAADWANELASRINQDVRQRTIAEATSTIAFLNNELAKTQVVELRSAISRVLETELKREMLANVSDEYAFKIVDPAVVPDSDDFVSPKRLILAIVGLVVGLGMGMLFVSIREQARLA